MNPSITWATNFFNECNSLPGMLENAMEAADEILLVNAGPGGKHSDDGSIEIAEKFGVPVQYSTIDNGFGALRTELIEKCKTDFLIIFDADERFHVRAPVLKCTGTERYPEIPNPDLKVEKFETYNQLDLLRSMMREADSQGKLAIRFTRRHWFAPGFTKACQNWQIINDHQLRCLKKSSQLTYRVGPKMHERLSHTGTKMCPDFIEQDEWVGPFFDHLHCFFKPMEDAQRQHDIRIYDCLDQNKPIPVA